MPWTVVKDTNACPASKPWAVKNKDTGDVNGRCHATRESALSQQRLLYAKLNRGEIMAEGVSSFIAFAEEITFSDDGLLWVEALPAKTWHDPRYGEIPITKEKLETMVKNFNDGVRGQEVMTDYEHGLDGAKGKKASGTYRKLDIRPHGDSTVSLWAGIEPTPTALDEIKSGEWKYFSLEWEDEWTHPETQEVHYDVITGGGLTNRPVAKGMMPINFSEVYEEKKKEFAATKKPYGDVTYADPGYQPDKKKRYPLDTEKHIRAAWSYINMPKNAKKYTSSQLASIKSKIRAAMKRIGANLKMAETDEIVENELNENLLTEDEAIEILNETIEHQITEPGTDGAIIPEVYPPNDDDSAESGSRVDTPPAGEDGTVPDRSTTVTNPNPLDEGGEVMTDEQLIELRKLLGVEEDADADAVLAGVKSMSEELTPLRELKTTLDSKRKFAEDYPDEAKRLAELQERDEENFAKQFSESFVSARITHTVGEGDDAKQEPTTLGFSGRVINEIRDCAKQFSEGKPTFDGFKGVLDAIMENGIVDYGNKGSDRQPENDEPEAPAIPGSQDARKRFAEKVDEIMAKDEVDFDTALETAAKLHPQLAEAWRQPPVAI